MAEQYFHLTLGPVQAFVAQARRTRDFWAGSFILSYLSSVAMTAVRQQKGEIKYPVPDDHFLSWLDGRTREGERPLQGSVPNRFKALGALVDADFNPQSVVDAVNLAWQALAGLVWTHDLQPVVGNNSPQYHLWQRQINHFWEISWCLTEEPSVSNLLDRRKNWRTHWQGDEKGVKCSLMEGYQELSGAVRPGEAVRTFWKAVRLQNHSLARDLRDDEHLCSIALVKRRFVHYFPQFKQELPAVGSHPGVTVYGWNIPTSVPSVAYLAALPWLSACIEMTPESPDLQQAVEALQHDLTRLDAPREGRVLRRIAEATQQAAFKGRAWHQVNGQYLFPSALHQQIKDVRRSDTLIEDEVQALVGLQSHLQTIRRVSGLGEPSPFYAILLMDGDALGVQMSNPLKQQGISKGLNDFTTGVPGIVDQFSGFLVYAGGDDVLALLPQPFAVACALEIQRFYDQCFARVNQQQGSQPIFTSISGAIEFAHYKMPLTRVLQDAHGLLDEVAKEKTGRNSLAVRLWLPGGINAEWSAPWTRVSDLLEVSRLVGHHLTGALPRGFFFKLEALIGQLGLSQSGHGFDDTTVQALVRAAWLHTGKKLHEVPSDLADRLLKACQIVKRHVNGESAQDIVTQEFASGALRLLQFLATENRQFMTSESRSLQETGA